MSSSEDQYWPFTLSDREKQSPELSDKIDFLKTVTALGFLGIQHSVDSFYSAKSTTRSGGIIRRGRRGRWELRLVENDNKSLVAFVCSFKVAATALLHWLQLRSAQDILLEIEDSLVVMGKSTPTYKIYNEARQITMSGDI